MIIQFIMVLIGMDVQGENMLKNFFKNKNNILILLGVLISVIIILFRIFSKDVNNYSITIVDSPSKFYTVSNCVSRYINYVYAEDVDNIILLIDDSFKKKNGITNNNVFDKIDKFDNLYSFQARKMYQQVVNDNVTKYYVKGYLIVDDISNVISEMKDYYIIVYLDTKNSTYSVTPYDGKIFVEGGK